MVLARLTAPGFLKVNPHVDGCPAFSSGAHGVRANVVCPGFVRTPLGWRPKLGVFLLILALVSPLPVPWSNRGASNLGESG